MSENEKAGSLFEQVQDLDSRYWIVNTMEMFERLAYYGVRSVVAIYMVLPREMGGPEFTHIEKGTIFAWWAGVQSILPMMTGGFADRYGHKKAISIALALNITGYIGMGLFQNFWGFLTGVLFVAAGTAVFKPGLQGTLAATLKKSEASVGWGVFYQIVNLGGFLGPVIAGMLRLLDWKYVFFASALIISINYLWLPFYKDPTEERENHGEMENPLQVLKTAIMGMFRPRLFFFIIVFSGFWLMFNQVFDLLPNVIDDWVDSSDIIAALGTAFSIPAVPWVLGAMGGLIFGALLAGIILLALRPDRRPITEVGKGPYVVTGIALFGALAFSLSLFLAAAIAIPLSLITAALLSIMLRQFQIPAKPIAIGIALVGLVGSGVSAGLSLSGSAKNLVELAAAGKQVNPEWIINLNPGLIVFTMVFFAYLTSFVRPLTSIIIGMSIATLGAVLSGHATVGFMTLGGILVFSVGEMLSSPKKMEYLASLAPKGQEGLYMGYVNIPIAIGWITGSKVANALYETMGDKVNLARRHMTDVLGVDVSSVTALKKTEVMPALADKLGVSVGDAQRMLFDTYEPAKLWLVIGGIGVASIVGMIIYDRVLYYIDRPKQNTEPKEEQSAA